jgi:hypothetical protein
MLAVRSLQSNSNSFYKIKTNESRVKKVVGGKEPKLAATKLLHRHLYCTNSLHNLLM